MWRAAALMLPLLLAGCPLGNVRPPKPEVVTVVVEKMVKVPEQLSRDCDEIPKQSNTYDEAKRLANARKASLDECTGRMREIRKLGEGK